MYRSLERSKNGVIANNPQPNQFGKSLEYNTIEAFAPYVPFPVNVILSNLWLSGPVVSRLASMSNIINAMLRTTTAITIVKAGYKENVIPVVANAVLDLRIHPGQSVQQAEFDIVKFRYFKQKFYFF